MAFPVDLAAHLAEYPVHCYRCYLVLQLVREFCGCLTKSVGRQISCAIDRQCCMSKRRQSEHVCSWKTVSISQRKLLFHVCKASRSQRVSKGLEACSWGAGKH